MRKARLNETQIIKVLKEVKDVSREDGISDATYYNWKSEYGGMVTQTTCLRHNTNHSLKNGSPVSKKSVAIQRTNRSLNPLIKKPARPACFMGVPASPHLACALNCAHQESWIIG